MGADLRLRSSPGGPYQDPSVGNFMPEGEQTCDSYISGINGGKSLNQALSFVIWGTVEPYVINVIWVQQSNDWPSNSSSLALQIAFTRTPSSVIDGVFQLIAPSGISWAVPVRFDPNIQLSATTSVTTPGSDGTSTPADEGINGASVTGIIIGVILLFSGVLVLVLVSRYFYRRNLVTRDIDAFEPAVQEDFLAVARAALRETPRKDELHYGGYSDFE